jgi:serine protease Do
MIMHRIRRLYIGLALAGLGVATITAPPPCPAAGSATAMDIVRQLNQAFIEVADKVSASVVVISVTQTPNRQLTIEEGHPFFDMLPRQFRSPRMPRVTTQGSGVVIREDGYILTNSHVVEDAEKIQVRFKDGREFTAEIRGVDPQSDIAVIKINARNLKPARLGDSAKTRVGEFAVAIGAPFDLDYSVTFGHVSAKGRSHIIPSFAGGAAMDQDFIQTDASINPGNSGGPLVNIDGEVIGINTLIRGLNTGIGFAVPVNLAREVADQLIAEGKFTRAWLGVSIVTLSEDKDFKTMVDGVNEGVVVREIIPDGPAAKSELKPADIITAVDGKAVATSPQLKAEIRNKKIGQPVVLDVVRDSKRIKVEVKPEAWPEEDLGVASTREPKDATADAANLGIRVQALNRDLAEQFKAGKAGGVLVSEVETDSPGAAAGVKPGDIITEINRKSIVSPRDFREAMRAADARKGILVQLLSDGASRFVILKDTGE